MFRSTLKSFINTTLICVALIFVTLIFADLFIFAQTSAVKFFKNQLYAVTIVAKNFQKSFY